MLVKAVAKGLTNQSVGIIGAGIGGLTAANALLKKEALCERVTVYEQAKEFLPTVGAGFGFSPNGQVCLHSIGFAEHAEILHPFNRLARLNTDGTQILQSSNGLKEIRDRVGFGIGGCLRADLVKILVEPLERSDSIKYSHKLIRIEPKLDKVELEFQNGHLDVVDLVVGADGIHSFVARALNIDHSPPIYSGSNIFYGVIHNPDSLAFSSPILEDIDNTVINGPGTGEFIVFPVGPPEQKKLIWANTYVASEPPARREEWGHEDNTRALDVILKQYPASHPIHELAQVTAPDQLLHFGLFYRAHKSRWFHGRVALLGDSCHATLPYVGQGANQAIEDAIVLADSLVASDNHIKAFQEYYRKRYPRTKRVVQVAGFLDKLYHSRNPLVQWFLEWLLGNIIRGGFVLKQVEREIVNECPVQDYEKYRSNH
jgi:salicylate hydroxylase